MAIGVNDGWLGITKRHSGSANGCLAADRRRPCPRISTKLRFVALSEASRLKVLNLWYVYDVQGYEIWSLPLYVGIRANSPRESYNLDFHCQLILLFWVRCSCAYV